MDASLGPGSAVRGNGKKTERNSKKKASEATISLSQTIARLDPLACLSFYAAFSTHCGAGSQAMWMHTMVFGLYPKRHQMV